LCVDELVEYSPECGRVRGRVREENPFLHPDGTLDPLASVELMAQALAAHEGFSRALDGKRPSGGFLVGVKDFEFTGVLRAGERFEVAARRGFQLESIRLGEGAVVAGGRPIAGGTLKFFLSESMTLPGAEDAGARLPSSWERRIFPLEDRWRLELDREGARARYRLDSTFPAFRGHFPDHPILPAVAAAALGADTVRALSGETIVLKQLKSGKFQRPLAPGVVVDVRCEGPGEGIEPCWSVRLYESEDLAATVVLVFDK
jgi:3-hydroxymyristoyl/3-hydroxydecanoyl-(acyl carrier protein) dehydratase